MKYYLSSYKLGNEVEKLKELIKQTSGKFAYIPNALDFTKADEVRRKTHIERDMDDLRQVGVEVELLDLKDYFDKQDALKEKLQSLGGVYISGGNSFVLRQAMKLSGLDEILKELRERDDFLYAGYSAAGCVLGPSLKAYEIVDPVDTPYAELKEVIWDGLGFVDFAFMPHWDSIHPESADIEKEIAYCKQNNIPYKALRDGEVLIIE